MVADIIRNFLLDPPPMLAVGSEIFLKQRNLVIACENSPSKTNDSKKYKFSVLAWMLMTNHVHRLCTPNNASGISQMMQFLDRTFVTYFNRSYKPTGTLWEGRFKSS
jgi:putative transposase